MSLTLDATTRLKDLLTHIYVLVPVLDNVKHYFVSTDEIDKLLRRGEGWLPQNPEKDLIVSRYLKARLRSRGLRSNVYSSTNPSARMPRLTKRPSRKSPILSPERTPSV